MPEEEDTGPDGAAAALDRAHERASQLAAQIGRLAGEIADSEERVARTYEDSARVRPHAAERLRGAARDAREFAARERDQSRRLLGAGETGDPEGGGTPTAGHP